MDWASCRLLVTGGTSFIGSHLCDHLFERGASQIRVVDDLSSGSLENIQAHLDAGRIEFLQGDLLVAGVAEESVRDVDVIFHLAAIHGGRGYVDLHEGLCAQNMTLDGLLIRAARDAGVRKLVFASSGCVYPNHIQADVERELYLSEDMVGPPYDADHMYGWAKLMTEMTLRHAYHDFGFESACARLFTVYGERGVENHAVIAMIARAFIGQDPFDVWGDGTQIRNWTYVGDTVRGLVLAGERIKDGSAVNIGSEERTRVIEAVHEVLRYTGHSAEIRLRPEMPTGPVNRVASGKLSSELLGWTPEVRFMDGLHRTIDWYFRTRSRERIRATLDRMLTER